MAKRILNTGNPYKVIPKSVFESGIASYLPKAYQNFYYQMEQEPTPVHYIPKAGKYVQDEKTGVVKPVQNVPIPLKFPREFDKCLLGGEGIIKGFYKSKPQVRRFPHFWIPKLSRTAVYSEILNQHMEVLATDRVVQLIHHYKGFDEYIMQTKAIDLRTKLALSIKRQMIKAIHAGIPGWADEPEEQREILAKYKKYGDQYTPEEADWFGYNLYDATQRMEKILEAEREAKIVPLKHEFRRKLIEDLKAVGMQNVERVVRTEQGKIVDFSGE
ncbi:39S ribosomal protein L28, mitochondrial isoform X2 [Contarinia nasturtii]|nr:39S ribosomal protein L28, mitochondrial isoform X2 [Contarinia nasturtii]